MNLHSAKLILDVINPYGVEKTFIVLNEHQQ